MLLQCKVTVSERQGNGIPLTNPLFHLEFTMASSPTAQTVLGNLMRLACIQTLKGTFFSSELKIMCPRHLAVLPSYRQH
ncbi:hypothetical protein chiPu_0019972 [Chiloscyllium punctatum]|uniref:Uncharacterized protein n=1 Tax=Chiloscyllium punctatum TaxID=137246 RepID=A0A401RTP4_CHIPU|nr:hypothetical protein [Chiloscyllium punctatum]